MAIIHCPACDRRISSAAPACPYCSQAAGEISDEARQRLRIRRWQDRNYRARMMTYVAMALVLAGIFGWWADAPQGLALPVPTAAMMLIALGLSLYLAGRTWIVWLRLREDPRRKDLN